MKNSIFNKIPLGLFLAFLTFTNLSSWAQDNSIGFKSGDALTHCRIIDAANSNTPISLDEGIFNSEEDDASHSFLGSDVQDFSFVERPVQDPNGLILKVHQALTTRLFAFFCVFRL